MKMPRKQIAIIGGADENRTYDPPVTDADGAITTARFIGGALAKAGYCMIVYASERIEKSAVEGFLKENPPPKSIIVLSPRTENVPKGFSQFGTNRAAFDPQTLSGERWGLSFYRSVSDANGLALIGGGRFTFTIGMLALTSRIPLVACAAFGGAAGSIWEALKDGKGLAESQDVNQMAQNGSPEMARACIESLKAQMKRKSVAAAASAKERCLSP
jgi:hypothetical protein